MDSRKSAKANSHRSYRHHGRGQALSGILSFSLSTREPGVPCFFSSMCHSFAAVEKNGKSVCLECAKKLPGPTFNQRRYRNMREYQLDNRTELSTLMTMMADPDFAAGE